VEFKVAKSGSVDGGSVKVTRSSGSSATDGCATSTIKGLRVAGVKKAGTARAAFVFQVLAE